MSYVRTIGDDRSAFDSQALNGKIIQWGASLVGFADVTTGLAKEFRHIPRAISLGLRHPPEITSIIQKDGVLAYSNQFPDIDDKLLYIEKKIVTFLRLKGYRALAIPPDSDRQDPRLISRLYPLFQHKTAATCAGLGWIGKNGLLINRQYGARLSWATVLTDAPLTVSTDPYLKGKCGSCSKCVNICPAGAFKNEEWVREQNTRAKIDVEGCSRQIERNHRILGQYICGLCILACPLGRKG